MQDFKKLNIKMFNLNRKQKTYCPKYIAQGCWIHSYIHRSMMNKIDHEAHF